MKRVSRLPSVLSESLHRQLHSYALAASAAGVGVLALASRAEGKIVYRHAHIEIPHYTKVIFSLNGLASFAFSNYSDRPASILKVAPGGQNGILGTQSCGERHPLVGCASALRSGVVVGRKDQFLNGSELMARFSITCSSTCRTYVRGKWANVTGRYLALKFFVNGQAHYGWARLNVAVNKQVGVNALITGYAYETVPNKPIKTGKTKGPDVITVQPATLGHLSHGASAIPAWRRKDQ